MSFVELPTNLNFVTLPKIFIKRITRVRPFLSRLYSLLKIFLLTGEMISYASFNIYGLNLRLFYNFLNFFHIDLFLMKIHLHLMRLFFALHLSLINLIKGLFIHYDTSCSIQLLNNGPFFHEMMNLLTKIFESFIRRWLKQLNSQLKISLKLPYKVP